MALAELDVNYTKYEIDLQNKPEWYAPKVNPASKVSVSFRTSTDPRRIHFHFKPSFIFYSESVAETFVFRMMNRFRP